MKPFLAALIFAAACFAAGSAGAEGFAPDRLARWAPIDTRSVLFFDKADQAYHVIFNRPCEALRGGEKPIPRLAGSGNDMFDGEGRDRVYFGRAYCSVKSVTAVDSGRVSELMRQARPRDE